MVNLRIESESEELAAEPDFYNEDRGDNEQRKRARDREDLNAEAMSHAGRKKLKKDKRRHSGKQDNPTHIR